MTYEQNPKKGERQITMKELAEIASQLEAKQNFEAWRGEVSCATAQAKIPPVDDLDLGLDTNDQTSSQPPR
jgi:hypothetical protein